MNRRILKDRFNSVLIKGLALTGIIVLIGLFIFIIKESVPALTKVGADLFTNFSWYPTYEDDPEYGLLTMIIDSGLITLLASVIVIPIGYFVAFFMYDYANKFEKGIIKSAIDSLSGVPSVVIGMFLILYVSPIFLKLNIWSGQNMLLGALGLVVLSLPYTASLMEESLSSVDKSLKEGSLALGSTRWTAGFKIVTRAALPGIVNSMILTVNRIIGETMVVLMAAGGANIIPESLFDPIRTLTSTIASEMVEVAVGSMHYSALFVAGLVLLIVSFILTLTSKYLSRRWSR